MNKLKQLIATAGLLFGTLICAAQTHTVANRDTANTFTGTPNQFTKGVQSGPVAFADLSNATLVNQGEGSLVWVTDAVAQNPCVGSGSGAFAFRENGAWNCAITGGGGGSGTVNAGTINHLSKYVGASTVGDSSVVDNGSTVSTTEDFSARTLASTVATGTAPLSVTSTTVVPNLNVSQLLGQTWANPGTIGGGTPGAATFTTATITTGNVTTLSAKTFETVEHADQYAGATADVKMNAALAVLLAGNGGILDTTGFGCTTQTIAAQVPIGSATRTVQWRYSPCTTYEITDTASDYVFPIYTGSSVVGIGTGGNLTGSTGTFVVKSTANIKAVFANGARDGTQEFFALEGPYIRSESGATISEALISLSGIFVNSYIRNVSTFNCYAPSSLYVTSPVSASINITSDVVFDNNNFDCTNHSTGPVVYIFRPSGVSAIGLLVFRGGGIQHAGNGQPLLKIDGNGGDSSVGHGISFISIDKNVQFETAGDGGASNAIQIIDAAHVEIDGLSVTGPAPAGTSNMVSISETVSGLTNNIEIRHAARGPIAWTHIVSNSIDGTTQSGPDFGDYSFRTKHLFDQVTILGTFDASGSSSFKPRSTSQANPNVPLIPCDFPDVIESSTSTPGQTHWTCTSHNVWTQNLNSGGGGGSATWGSITGTLSSQSDLQTALNGKLATGLAVLLTPGASQTIQPSLSTAIALASKCPASAGSTLACLEALDNTGAVIFAAQQNGTTQFGTGVGGQITLTDIVGPNSNPATTGQVRVSTTDSAICWRSNDNTTNYCLAKTAANIITSDLAIAVKETAAGSGIPGYGVLYEDSTTHVPMWSANNGSFQVIPRETGGMTNGHLVSINANTDQIQDSGIAYSTIFTGTPTNHGVALGSTTQALSFTGAGTSGQCLLSGGASADPAFGACPGGGSSALSSITAAVGSNSINNGDNPQVWNFQGTTSGRIAFKISENSASTSAGTPVLFQVSAIASSTMNPVQFDFNGNGIRMNTSGQVTAIGTGGILPTALTSVTGTGAAVLATGPTNFSIDAEATGNAFTRPFYVEFTPSCNNTTASSGSFDIPTASTTTFTCFGSTTTHGVADYVDGSTTINTGHFTLPQGWTGNMDARISWFANAASSNAVRWSLQTGCVADGDAVDTGPSYNTASASNTAYTGTANQRKTTTLSAIAMTNCSAGEEMYFRLSRIGGDAGDTLTATAELISLQFEGRTTK